MFCDKVFDKCDITSQFQLYSALDNMVTYNILYVAKQLHIVISKILQMMNGLFSMKAK